MVDQLEQKLPYLKNMNPTSVAPVCISMISGMPPHGDSFHVSVHGWNGGAKLNYYDCTIPASLDLERLARFNLPDAVVIAVQKSQDKEVLSRLLKKGLNIFFSWKHKRFFMLKQQFIKGKKVWIRHTLHSLREFVGMQVRFFVLHT